MMIPFLLVALVLVLGITTLEGVLLVMLLHQLPRWRWQLLCLHFHARYAYLLFRMRMLWSKMHMALHLLPSPDEIGEQHCWIWSEMADAVHMALAMDIALFCQAGQEVAA